MSSATAQSGRCRGCGCTNSRACPDGCWRVAVSSECGPLCSECAYLVLLVDAGLVADDDGGLYALNDLASDLGMAGIARVAAELASVGVVIPSKPAAPAPKPSESPQAIGGPSTS